ncbi:hypothetical protein PBI_SCTP2_51 [Salicola phage SCTP-2]|nr:hypothetical protein PBI_SCTP2_51 [Salicola phage SCTP-2]
MAIINSWNNILTVSKLIEHIYNQDIHCIDESYIKPSKYYNNSIVFHDDQFNSSIKLNYDFTKPLRKNCIYGNYDTDQQQYIDDIVKDNEVNYAHLKRVINNNKDKPDNKVILYHYNVTQFMSKMLTSHTANRVEKNEPYFISDNNSMINLNEDEIGVVIHTALRDRYNNVIGCNESRSIKHLYNDFDDDKQYDNRKGIIHLSMGVDKYQRYLLATVKIKNLHSLMKYIKLYGLNVNGYLLYTYNFEKLIMNHYHQHNFLQLFNFFPQLDMFLRLCRMN